MKLFTKIISKVRKLKEKTYDLIKHSPLVIGGAHWFGLNSIFSITAGQLISSKKSIKMNISSEN